MNQPELKHIYQKLKNREATILDLERFRKAAVLLPLVEVDGKLQLLFEVRSTRLRSQPGEICFPGGQVDQEDPDYATAARRETCEELGLTSDQVQIFSALDYLVTPFNTIIYPFIGQIHSEAKIKPNREEVEKVFYVPLDFLKEAVPERHEVRLQVEAPEDFPFQWIIQGENYKWRLGSIPQYFYHYQEYVIWGITARILHHFIQVID